jgi:hypothetical protein
MSSSHTDLKSRSPFYLWIFGLVFSACFTVVIWLLEPNLKHFLASLLPDRGASWYYWKLPDRDVWSMVIVWIFYLGHQFLIWIAIYLGQRDLRGFRSASLWGLPKYCIAVLAVNTVFIFLHLMQTHLWFDGLA